MGKLILVRHGHTPLNSPGEDERLRSWLNVPLDQKGLEEAARTADMLKLPHRRHFLLGPAPGASDRRSLAAPGQGSGDGDQRTAPVESGRIWRAKG